MSCQAITLKGLPCKCKSKKDSEYCSRHTNCFECSVCLFGKSKRQKLTLNCGHSFCKSCIDTWTKTNNSCPLCRKPILDEFVFIETSLSFLLNSFTEHSNFNAALYQFEQMCKLFNTDSGFRYLNMKDSVVLKNVFISKLLSFPTSSSRPHMNRSIEIYIPY